MGQRWSVNSNSLPHIVLKSGYSLRHQKSVIMLISFNGYLKETYFAYGSWGPSNGNTWHSTHRFFRISPLCGTISWFLQITPVWDYFPLLGCCYAIARSWTIIRCVYDITTDPMMSYNVPYDLWMNGEMIYLTIAFFCYFPLKFRTLTQ